MDEVDDVIRRVNAREPMPAPELDRARSLLTRHVRSGRPGLAEARVRVAVELERREREGTAGT
ncbi:hypothetical protein [Geodermatophilus sp. CPCC 206100]|uniref:hypothetical protein n=1 Tax=Geodermatophilus sp. CPCC 206100 TaxID=3020054 RepID=UPI003B001871